MSDQKIPTDQELDSSLSLVLGAARASGRVGNIQVHTAVVEGAARKGIQALRLLPDLKKALSPKATKAQHAAALKQLGELTGEPHQEEEEKEEE